MLQLQDDAPQLEAVPIEMLSQAVTQERHQQVQHQNEFQQVQTMQENKFGDTKIEDNMVLQPYDVYTPVVSTKKTLRQNFTKCLLVLGIISNCILLFIYLFYANRISNLNDKIAIFKLEHQIKKNKISISQANLLMQQIENISKSYILIVYEAAQIITLIFHSILTLIAAFLPDRHKFKLFQSLNGRFLCYLAFASVLISLLNTSSQAAIIQYAQMFQKLLEDFLQEYHEIAKQQDRPKTFIIEDKNIRGGIGQCVNLIYGAQQQKMGVIRESEDQDSIVGGLFLLCFFFKKRDRLFTLWIASILVELIASIFLLIHFKLYRQKLLTIQNHSTKQLEQNRQPKHIEFQDENQNEEDLAKWGSHGPKSPKTQEESENASQQIKTATNRAEDSQNQVQSDRSTSQILVNEDQHQQFEKGIVKYFGKVSTIGEPGGEDFSNYSNQQQEISTIKRTKKYKNQRVNAFKIATDRANGQITQNCYTKQSQIVASSTKQKDTQVQEI